MNRLSITHIATLLHRKAMSRWKTRTSNTAAWPSADYAGDTEVAQRCSAMPTSVGVIRLTDAPRLHQITIYSNCYAGMRCLATGRPTRRTPGGKPKCVLVVRHRQHAAQPRPGLRRFRCVEIQARAFFFSLRSHEVPGDPRSHCSNFRSNRRILPTHAMELLHGTAPHPLTRDHQEHQARR